ncbi:hypothetical protein GCM10027605_60050 [Micromonospora zhanjiangensis]
MTSGEPATPTGRTSATGGFPPRGGPAHRFYSVLVFVVLASLDNVAIGLVPPLYGPISTALAVPQRAVGFVTAASFLVSAVAAVGWAYSGDRTNRKPLLMIGTLIWAAGTAGSGYAANYPLFLLAQLVAAVGLGAVGSVGFSVVTDLISPRRRGLVMSFWGLSQGSGRWPGRWPAESWAPPTGAAPSCCSASPAWSPRRPTSSRTTSGRARASRSWPGRRTTTTGSAVRTCPASSPDGPTSG